MSDNSIPIALAFALAFALVLALAFAITPSEKIDSLFMRLSISTHGTPPYNELCRAPNADCLDTPDPRVPNLL
jgi:hypothetical protein